MCNEDESIIISSYPAGDRIEVAGVELDKVTILIHGMNGRVVEGWSAGYQAISLDGMPAGMYFLRFRDDAGVRVKKFVKGE